LRWAGLALFAAGLAGVYIFDHKILELKGLAQQWQRIVFFGIPAALAVFGLVVIEKGGWAVKNRLVLALGAASYAIYLLHPPVFFFVYNMKAGPFESQVKIFAILTVATLLVSLGFYYAVEKPLLRVLRRWLTHGDPPRSIA